MHNAKYKQTKSLLIILFREDIKIFEFIIKKKEKEKKIK